MSIGLKLQHYLMASYLYYIHDMSMLDDSVYDGYCKDLLEQYDTFEHQHKYLLDKEELACGSGYRVAYTVPLRVKSAAMYLKERGGYERTD